MSRPKPEYTPTPAGRGTDSTPESYQGWSPPDLDAPGATLQGGCGRLEKESPERSEKFDPANAG